MIVTSLTASTRLYNEMLYLCEKYAPLAVSARYDPEKDIHVTGKFIEHPTQAMKSQVV